MAVNRDLSKFANHIFNHDNGNIGLSTDSATLIGIGTDSPRAKLDVDGDFRVSGISTFKNLVFFDSDITVSGSAQYTGVTTFSDTNVIDLTAENLTVTSQATINSLDISRSSVTYQGTLTGISTNIITDTSTTNIEVGDEVFGDKIDSNTTVASIGSSAITLSQNTTNNITILGKSGIFESANGNIIVGIDTSNIVVGYGITNQYIGQGTTISSIGINSVTVSQSASNTYSKLLKTGTLSGVSTNIISGIDTTGIQLNQLVVGDFILLASQTSVSAINVGEVVLSANATNTGVHTANYEIYFVDNFDIFPLVASFTGNYEYRTPSSGIATVYDLSGTTIDYTSGTIDSLTGQTLNYVTATATTLNSTTLNSVDLDATNLVSQSGIISSFQATSLIVSGISTVDYINGSSVGFNTGYISALVGTNIDYAGVGTIANIRGENISYTGVSTFNAVGASTITSNNLTVSNLITTTDLNVNSATVQSLDSNTAVISNLVAGQVNSNTGVVTTLSGTDATYTNVNLDKLAFAGVNTSNNYNTTVNITPSQSGFATSYNLVLPPSLGIPGQVLALQDSNGTLGFSTSGLYENRIYVSPVSGNDANDGKAQPVKTIKRAAQLASFESFVLPGARYADAGNLLLLNKSFISNEVVGFVTYTHPGISTNPDYDPTKCGRDVGLIVDALYYDLTYGGNSKTIEAGLKYWEGTTNYVDGETTETIDAFNHIITISQYVINNVALPDTINRFNDGSNLLILNKEFIKEEVVGFVTATYPGLLTNPDYDETKCKRDVGLIVDAVTYDLAYGGNRKSVETGLSYWSGATNYVAGETTETIAAYNHIVGISSFIINNTSIPTSYQGSGAVSQVFDNTISYDDSCNSSAYNSTCCANVQSAIANYVGIITSIIGVGTDAAPTLSQPTGSFQPENGQTFQSFDLEISYDAQCGTGNSYSANCCADVFSAISNYVGIVTTIIGVGTDSAPELNLPTSQSTPVAVFVEAGEYLEDNPILMYEDVAIIGDNLRNTIVRPLNSGKDLFRLRNGCYLTGFAMKDSVDSAGVPQFTFDNAVAFDDPSDTTTSRTGYAIKVDKPVITRSPYIQNCSILSFLGANGVLVDGSKVDTLNTPIVRQEGENPVEGDQPEQGKSMVAAAFTMVSFGGIGWRVINDGYSQVVSCFQIFCRYGSLAQSGGYLSITNSATNFGFYALRSTGFNFRSYIFDRGIVASTGTSGGLQTLKVVGLGRSDQELYVLKFFDHGFNDQTSNFKLASVIREVDISVGVNTVTDTIGIQTHGFNTGDSIIYVGNENTIPKQIIGGLVNLNEYFAEYVDDDNFTLYEDDSLTRRVDLTSVTSGINTFIKGNQEFFNFEKIDAHKSYQRISFASTTSNLTFITGRQVTQTVNGGTAVGFAVTYNTTNNELLMSVEAAGGVRNNFGITGVGLNEFIEDHSSSPVSAAATSIVGITSFHTIEFKVDSTQSGSNIIGISALPENFRVHFHRPSIVNSSSHTWEYSGSGVDYNALPQNGGKTDTRTEQVFSQGGRVYSSGTNELGDFKIGNFITAFNRTGNIVFNNKVSIGQLDSLRLSLSGGVAVEEFSIDVGLGDNEIGGSQDYRISTQRAVRTFLNNRLGNFIDKEVSTNAVPSAVVQLNAFGQINADLIPPKVVNYYTANVGGGRTTLVDRIPPVNLKNGDTVIEPGQGFVLISDVYSQFLVLDDNTRDYNFNNGDTVISAVSDGGAIGIVTYPTTIGYGYTGLVKGVALTASVIDGGGGYSNPGIYTSVLLNNPVTGIGVSANATITVGASGTVTQCTVVYGGRYYAEGDIVSITNPTTLGGRSGGSEFQARIDIVETRLYIELTNNQKFTGSTLLTDYIADGDAIGISTVLTDEYQVTFNPNSSATGGDIDFDNDRIMLGVNEFSDGDPIKYSAEGGNTLESLISGNTYYVKRVGISSVELYTSYALSTKLDFLSNGTGTHSLTRKTVNTVSDQIVLVDHGFSTGDAVRISGDTPSGISTGSFYFIGSLTTNSFSLHPTQSAALSAVNGLIFNPVNITQVGSGSLTLTKQNVEYSSTVNTSSSLLDNWTVLASGSVDAANIASGTISPSRLGSGTANSDTFLGGDSIYRKAVKSVGIGTTTPFQVVADSFEVDGDIIKYSGDLELNLLRVEASFDNFSSLGISKFKSSTFEIGDDGAVSIKNSQVGDVDATSLGGFAPAYYLDLNNTTGTIPIPRGGTGLSALPSNGAILIGNGSAYNLTGSPTISGRLTGNLAIPSNGDIVLSTGTWTGEKGCKIQNHNNQLYLQFTTSLVARNSSGTNRLTLTSGGNLDVTGEVRGSTLKSDVANGTAPIEVTSTTLVSNLNADLLDGIQGSQYLRSDTSDTVTGGSILNFQTSGGNTRGYLQATDTDDAHFIIATSGGEDIAFKDGGVSGTTNMIIRGDGTLLQGTSNTIWHAGNDGSGSGLDADLLDGLQLHTGRNNEANKVVRTDGSGYIQAGWINTPSGDATTNTPDKFYGSYDGYVRYYNRAYTQMYLGNTYKYTTSRRQHTTDSNYWVGTMGWGTTNLNDVIEWGSGFWDSWSNPANQPSGTSHWVGLNALHYTNGTNTYGWQLTVGAGNPSLMYVRGQWGSSPGSWYKVWNAANDGSGSGLDADTVDGIQGGSFLRSDANDVIGGVLSYHSNDPRLQFRNTSYNAYLYIGGWTNSNSNNISRIRNSNANLHMDSGANGNLYLNHYSGGTVYARQQVVWHAGNDGAGSGLDADNLDGKTWDSSGKNVRATEFYADNWFRNYNSGEGIYNQATAMHWYSDSSSRWRCYSTSTTSQILFTTNGNSVRGSVYADNSNNIGFLDSDGNWGVRVVRDSYVELRDNNEVTFRAGQGGVDGNYGTVQTHGAGKGGWEGYSINGRYVMMSDDNETCGWYNDIDNEWIILYERNDYVNHYDPDGGNIWLQMDNGEMYSYIHNRFTDNDELRLGTGADFRMWHNGSHTYFRNYNHGSGDLYWQGEDNEGTNHALLYMFTSGSRPYLSLYENGGERLRTTSAGVTVYGNLNSTSDQRYKKNIEPIDDALNKIEQLEGVTFDWNNDVFPEGNGEDDNATSKPDFDRRATGVIAQSVEKVLPEAVTEDSETGMKNVAYGNMIGLLIEGIKEMNEKLSSFEDRLNKLEDNDAN